MERFSTSVVPASRRVDWWNALASEEFAMMEIRPRDADSFSGELLVEASGPLTLMNVRSSAVRILHTRMHASRFASPSFLLLASLEGGISLSLEQGRPIDLPVGQICLIDHSRPYRVDHGQMQTLCVEIPRYLLEAHIPVPDALVGKPLPPDRVAARVLWRLLSGIDADMRRPQYDPADQQFGWRLFGFVADALAGEETSAPQAAVARVQRILGLIEERLCDPELSPAHIAHMAGISERRLRAVLAQQQQSFSGYVRRQRLARCATWLRDPDWSGISITQIAFRAGFNNATHFGHAFRAAYGMTPRDWRASS